MKTTSGTQDPYEKERNPFVNCHTHTFTGDHIPQFLGKKLLPAGLEFILTIRLIIDFFRWYYRVPAKWQYKRPYKAWQAFHFRVKWFLQKVPFITIPIAVVLTLDTLLILFFGYFEGKYHDEMGFQYIKWLNDFMQTIYLLPHPDHTVLRFLIVMALFLLIKSGRKLIIFIAKSLFQFLRILPGPETKAYLKRYISIGRFAFHKSQMTIFRMLEKQYPVDSRFVVLPMDMDYMDAGTPKSGYMKQLEELKKLRRTKPKTCLPFVFADPRRIKDDTSYFAEIKNCIVHEEFRGIKTYPALGYYPFDKDILPLMLWACENQIPVLNHCIRGTIYYRGNKKKEWNSHPVFRQSTGEKGKSEPLALYEINNSNFSTNFTHPLNYLCLLNEDYLKRLLEHYNDESLYSLFGYAGKNLPLARNLHELKICFGHFGGEDEWTKYMERDRFLSENGFTNPVGKGINFIPTALENSWRYNSWFSIIYSLMLQYPNVYADISYILHDENIFPLLKSLLKKDSRISDRILYGSDFYVVRSQKSDKQMWADTSGRLTDLELELITRDNPRKFLYNHIHQYVK
ncbi:amidohydrolase family protein [Chryseobacterium sp.]|uniref:amidohydrolase family protein n=1 Tax=Chryseobacterium sp. TaxID=1871047 RepID=UPI00261EECD8|nr:amidohydrolase family protein [Chryseobacterium sp.]